MVHKYLLSALTVAAMACLGANAQPISHDWTTVIDIAEGATSCEDGRDFSNKNCYNS